ncbi:hypothetical protein NDU88_004229 [Pleurodeles waltl]|uniref:Uncharacterized protein n=1 Tax=Pleurodeles waltl TaxID=8319 RepID=A0AAV7V0N6_PLEWA|nr:hypothetical protein NDU88_004229 [Pleurodeles waltl]
MSAGPLAPDLAAHAGGLRGRGGGCYSPARRPLQARTSIFADPGGAPQPSPTDPSLCERAQLCLAATVPCGMEGHHSSAGRDRHALKGCSTLCCAPRGAPRSYGTGARAADARVSLIAPHQKEGFWYGHGSH